MDKDHALEEMMGKLGDFGRYQCFQFILHILAAMTAGMHMLSLVTVAAVPDHRCFLDGVDSDSATAWPWNVTSVREAIPHAADGTLDSCHVLRGNASVACDRWVYDTKYRTSSLAIEWDLVCDRRWMGALAQTVFMFGVFTGAVVLGGMADKLGRKTIFCWSAVLQLIFGVAAAFIPNYWGFLVVEFIYGIFGSAGSYITGFVLTMELVGPSKRTSCGIAFQAAFAGGIILVAAWGALLTYNRQILQVVYGLHSLLLLGHIWIMDESPRWLWAQGRARESVAIVEKALKFNKSPETLNRAQLISRGNVESTKEDATPAAGTLDLFKSPNLRNKTLNVCFCWFANSLVYYGLSLSAGKLSGNPYLIMAILGFVELPSYVAVVYTLDILGRRPLISSMMLIGGVACIVAAFLPSGGTASTSVVVIGKLFIAGSFAIVYNYSAELFPTVVRNSALGLGSMCARLSGALTPLISLLDSFDPRIPAVIFGVIALVSGFLCFLLPETMDQPMPQSIADGESFGRGDTCFTSCASKRRNRTHSVDNKLPETMVPLDTMRKGS